MTRPKDQRAHTAFHGIASSLLVLGGYVEVGWIKDKRLYKSDAYSVPS